MFNLQMDRNDKEDIHFASKDICLETYVAGVGIEKQLKDTAIAILEQYQRVDLLDLVYISAKELLVNASKAAIKRLFFYDAGLDPHDPKVYEQQISKFQVNLTQENLATYHEKLAAHNLKTSIHFSHDADKIIIRVINNFLLLPQEEQRIREKFRKAKQYENIVDFYLEHGDRTEGAGLGITLVEILMAQNGFDRHLFTISSSQKTGNTIAKIVIPLKVNYVSSRQKFEIELRKKKLSRDILRKDLVVNEC